MSLAAFSSVAALFPEPLLFVTPEGRILGANAAVREQLRLPGEGLAGRRLHDFLIGSPDTVSAYLRDCARSGSLLPGVLTVQASPHPIACRADGGVVRPRTDSEPALLLLRLTPKNEAISQFLLLSQKIEELTYEIAKRRRAEELLRAERQRFQVTLSSIGDAVIATDASGRITFMNPVAEKLSGWSAAEAEARPLEDIFRIINEETRAAAENPVSKVLAGGHTVGLANHTVLRGKDGTERPIADSAAPIRDPLGRVIGTVLVFHDITDRRAREREEARTRSDLLEKIAELEEFEQAVVGRELRMIDLKRQVDTLTEENRRLQSALAALKSRH